MLCGTRIFKKLDIAHIGFGSYSYDKYILDSFAYYQWTKDIPFISGPCMYLEKAPDEYSYWSQALKIQQSMKYFMKPYNIQLFGNNITDNTQSHLLIRGWLNSIKDCNNVLILMERVELDKNRNSIIQYMNNINNRSWQPLQWTDIEKSNTLIQHLDCNTSSESLNKYNLNIKLE
jgi:hypothetical protein